MASEFEKRFAALIILNNAPQPLPNHVAAVTRLTRDTLGPSNLDLSTVTDADLLAALHSVRDDPANARHFADAQPATKAAPQSLNARGMAKLDQANTESAARERSAKPTGEKSHMETWSRARADDPKWQRLSTAQKLDCFEVELEAFRSGRRNG